MVSKNAPRKVVICHPRPETAETAASRPGSRPGQIAMAKPPSVHYMLRGRGGKNLRIWESSTKSCGLKKNTWHEIRLPLISILYCPASQTSQNVLFLSMISDRQLCKQPNQPTGLGCTTPLGLSDFGRSHSRSHQPGETCSKESLNIGCPVISTSPGQGGWSLLSELPVGRMMEVGKLTVFLFTVDCETICVHQCVLLEGQHIPPQRIWYRGPSIQSPPTISSTDRLRDRSGILATHMTHITQTYENRARR